MNLVKTPEEIKILRQGGNILAEVMREIMAVTQPGISTGELDQLARKLIAKAGARPSFLNYRGYPASICISVNDEVVHGIPRSDKILQLGDIVGLDLGLEYQGLFTDMARTVGVGKISDKAQRLIEVARDSLKCGLRKVKHGAKVGDIGSVIQKHIEGQGFSVVRDLVGHGVGYAVHEEPQIPNFGVPGSGMRLEMGMILAIEPMVNEGTFRVKTLDDDWTVVTVDSKLSAHWEDTIVVTENGYEILTS